jgi:hypothetical protein
VESILSTHIRYIDDLLCDINLTAETCEYVRDITRILVFSCIDAQSVHTKRDQVVRIGSELAAHVIRIGSEAENGVRSSHFSP